MQAVSGAKYLAFNLFDENGLDFTTVALSGIKDHIKKAVELLGFKIIGKKWDHDPERAKKINSNIITRYKNLQELTGTVIYKSIVSVIEKTFKIGEVVVVKIMKGDTIVGDFTLLMPKGEFLKNDISVELFAQQVGLFIDRFNTEKELKLSEVKYRSLVNLMQVGVIIQGPKAEILYCNPKALELLGLSENQLLGKTSFDSDWNVIHEDGSPYLGSSHPVPLAIETRLPVMNAIMGVYRPVLHDRVWLLVDAEPQLDKKGNVQQIICTFIDISYRKQIESELKESEEKYRLLLENSGIGVGSFSLEGKILFFNQKALENLGGKAEDFIGKSLHDLYGEELATEYLNRFREAVQSEKNIEYEDIVPLDSGNRCFLSNYSKIKNYNGDIVGVQVLAHDITERKLAEKVLQKNLNILNETGKIAKVGGWELNLDTGVQSWTDEIFRIFEMDVVKGSEPPLAESIELYAPVSRSIIADAVQRAIDYGESFDLQLQVITKKSNHIWVHAVGMANLENNKVLSLSGTIQNINEYKLVEEALLKTNAYLENLINYANAPIIVWDTKFCIIRFNHAFEILTGLKEADVLGKPLDILFPLEFAGKSMEIIQKTLTGEHLETVEIDIKHLDGTINTLLWNTATLFEKDGITPIAIIAQGYNITDRKQAEAELNLKNEELNKLNATKDKFFSIIAHDLRSPFNSFLGLTQIMAEELPSLTMDEIQKFADSMRKSATNLYRLLGNLLEWSQMQQGLIPYNPEFIHLLSVVTESVEMALEPAKNKQIEMVIDIPPIIEVYAENNSLQTVIRNLVFNAIKFTTKGGNIYIGAKQNPDNSVEVSVKDTGIGMKPSMIENLFKLDVSTSRKGTEGELSTGLGLFLCKEYVEKHGGKLWVESEEGKGSTFRFTIKGQ
jgi:PAS domain S-box-containing protein